MALGKRPEGRQEELFVATSDIRRLSHPFYRALERLLQAERFDAFAEEACRAFYAPTRGRPSIPRGVYFRMLLTYANRRRIRGKRLLRQRGEKLERGFAHLLETGALRRATVRGQHNILKRMLVHAAASNPGLLMRHRHGVGTPRSLQGRAAASMATVGQAATAVYLSMFLGLGRLVGLVSSIFAPARPANRISPLRTMIQRKDPGTAKTGPKAIPATGFHGKTLFPVRQRAGCRGENC